MSFLLNDYDDGMSCYVFRDGELVSQPEPIVEILAYDEMIGSATVYSGEGTIYFYFSGADQAAVEDVLAGLK